MSVERSFEAWEEIHRHGQDLADRLAQGFNGLITHPPPPFSWNPNPSKNPFDSDGVNAIFDFGNRLGKVGAEFGAGINGMVTQLFRQLPVPFRHEEPRSVTKSADFEKDTFVCGVNGEIIEGIGNLGIQGLGEASGQEEAGEEGGIDFDVRSSFGRYRKSKGSVNITTTYDSRTQSTESSFAARGDFWRIETTNGGSSSGNENAPLFLVQLGPVLFVRDTTLLLPVHLSKQHLLWYGYDRKNGLHSLCPAIWSKHRRWLLMSMICLNPVACSFMDLQFPNGQLTYVAGEGLTTSAFLPICGGLLQAQGRYPGETKFSFSYKTKQGTRVTPMVQWPDRSFSFGVAHAMAWKRSGLIMRPSVQLSFCPTFGGSNPGMRTELIHSIKEEVNLIYGCSCTRHPSAYASISLGRSKWNGQVGNSGAVFRMECPLSNIGRPHFSLQLNSGFEF